jgi:prolyl-tRNA editing enzyme YbaK/EbsC (Cys-tRNA(Pro) deacylase)
MPRMDDEERVRAALAEHGIAHERIVIDPAHADTAAFCEVYGYPPETSANTIVVASKRGERRHVACVLLATTRLDVNGVVRKTAGFSKASFADAEDTAALTGMKIGGVTPFGLPEGLPLYVDARVLEAPRVIVGGGSRSLKLEIDPRDLLRLPGAQVVEDLAREG